MAIYKYDHLLQGSKSKEFDSLHTPGALTPFHGIYRCEVCGREVVSEESKPPPPQNHHQHSFGRGPIRWRLIVYSDGKAKQ